MLSLLLTILGIGLLLFIHEGGHFIAARMAGVRVETFSLGFGPRLCGWTRNGCDFRISAIPIGGYVKMAGEEQTQPPQPGELGAASPGWRFLIYSGGILMNFLFALIVFPILFGIGVPFLAPVAGSIVPGGPAWEAGMQEGDRVLTMNGSRVHSWRSFMSAIALSGKDDRFDVELQRIDGSLHTLQLTPKYNEAQGFRMVGVGVPTFSPQLEIGALSGTRAEELGIERGDRLTRMQGVSELTPASAVALLRDAVQRQIPLEIEIEREDGKRQAYTIPLEPLSDQPSPLKIGIGEWPNRVKQARGALAEIFHPGDLILEVDAVPYHDPYTLYAAGYRSGGLPSLTILRNGQQIVQEARPDLDPSRIAAELWLEKEAADEREGLPISVRPGFPAYEAGLRSGDRLIRMDGNVIDDFAVIQTRVREFDGEPIGFAVERSSEVDLLHLQVTPDDEPVKVFGIAPPPYKEIVRSESFMDSLRMGMAESVQLITDVFTTMRRMVTGDVAADNLGGIITIGRLTHSFADEGLVPLFFFLALISINLGVLNLLPIPALDGGHLLFVIIEKIRGRPLGERAQSVFNLVGFAAVLALVAFVTWMDIRRLIE